MADAPMAVVETERFLKDAKPMLSDAGRAELVAFIGSNPEAASLSRRPAACGRFGGR
ncbi:MAG TPA: hypothetical protein VKJ01_20720 [Candidatus Solibacter sp.]|nr:hypothetical protein [Candidatus Solibacter sp.]